MFVCNFLQTQTDVCLGPTKDHIHRMFRSRLVWGHLTFGRLTRMAMVSEHGGTIIAGCPVPGPGRALISASGSYWRKSFAGGPDEILFSNDF
jgi:hypothetical protein